ncbi:MAG: hypothetical protein QOD75_1459 [Blastocatellia bacterium]|jgi:hypothetical protein|nr:hypothetical protein [Blastocatellia bacterium]
MLRATHPLPRGGTDLMRSLVGVREALKLHRDLSWVQTRFEL